MILPRFFMAVKGIFQFRKTTGRRELAMRLVEACGGNFEIVRAEIARLEQFAKKIKGA